MTWRAIGWSVTVWLCASAASAATLTVNAGGNLQAALNAANPGDTILLQAGATFTGNFTLPVKPGATTYITLRSSAPDSALPPAGQRITPAYASQLPKIRATSAGGTALITAVSASYWRLQFLEFLPGAIGAADLVSFGRGGSSQDTLNKVPHHLIMDRCYLHGLSSTGQRHGLALHSGDTQVINSYFSDFKGISEDTQALGGTNGPGPYLIENNYLEAAGENIMFGGSDPSIVNLVPSNITIRRNHITKPLAWMSQSWLVKNLIEFKNAANVLVEGNVIENNWAHGQQGYSILFTPRNQNGTAPWSVVRNITVRHNIIRHVAAVFNISGFDNLHPSQQTRDIVIANNLVYDVSTAYAKPGQLANGAFGVIAAGPKNITIDHNTVDNNGTAIIGFDKGYAPAGWQILGLQITDNLLRDNRYGIFGAGSSEGTPSLTTYAPGVVFLGNAIGGASAKTYPTGNDYPTLTQWLADFVSVSAADYRLVSTSASNNAATDGTDIGVNFSTLNAAIAGTAPPPEPPPAPMPSGVRPYLGTPVSLPGTVQAENFDIGGIGVAYGDASTGNTGGAYRDNHVDIEATTDTSGGYNVGWVEAGEWLGYTVKVGTAGTYAFDVRVAQKGSGGTFHIEVDGVNKTGSMVAPNTGGWQTWTTMTKTGVALTAGTHLIRIVMDVEGTGGWVANFNWLTVRYGTDPPPAPMPGDVKPYLGTPVSLPGTVQAENFDIGGIGVAYGDASTGNTGGAYRDNHVDIQATTDTGGGYNVGWVEAGEWLGYTVKVGTAGTYAFDVRVAQKGSGGTFHIEVDGVNKTGSMVAPNTGGWQTWTTMTKTGVALTAGTHLIRIVMDAEGTGGWVANFNWLKVR